MGTGAVVADLRGADSDASAVEDSQDGVGNTNVIHPNGMSEEPMTAQAVEIDVVYCQHRLGCTRLCIKPDKDTRAYHRHIGIRPHSDKRHLALGDGEARIQAP